MGNTFAYIMLVIWPLLAVCLYQFKSIQVATLWTIVGGFMFLPVKTAVDLPMIPPMGKDTIPVVAALIGCWLIKKKHISYIKELGKIKYLVILLFIVPFISAVLNSDAISVGETFLVGTSYYDGLSQVMRIFLMTAPFFIGRQLFRSYEDQLLMFKFLVMAGLFYSLPILFEVRMSPQLHFWIYGYVPSSFGQQMRFDGFRPMVFMGHGLLVSFFVTIALISAVVLWKVRTKERLFSSPVVSYYILAVLVLCKSVASIFYGLFAFLLVKGTKPKTQHKVALILMAFTILYPVLSISKIFPHQMLVDVAASFSPERAQSLEFRFDNEKMLLARASDRIFFGWSGWGRNRVYSEDTGRDLSVTDGHWIITLGTFGILGFIAEFGLLAITVLQAYSASKLLKSRPEQILLAGHAVLVGVILIDQIPNSSLVPWLWLLAGILLGRSEEIILRNKT